MLHPSIAWPSGHDQINNKRAGIKRELAAEKRRELKSICIKSRPWGLHITCSAMMMMSNQQERKRLPLPRPCLSFSRRAAVGSLVERFIFVTGFEKSGESIHSFNTIVLRTSLVTPRPGCFGNIGELSPHPSLRKGEALSAEGRVPLCLLSLSCSLQQPPCRGCPPIEKSEQLGRSAQSMMHPPYY